jgi:hypothetical protein
MKRAGNTKCSFLILSIIVFQINSTIAQQDYLAFTASSKSVTFTDNFADNSNKWITDNTWIKARAENGYYNISCKNFQQSTGLTCRIIGTGQSGNYEIETGIKIINGAGALVFGMTDKFDHYRIEISDKNTLEVIKDTPTKKKKVEKIFSAVSNTHLVKDSYNKLTVRSVNGVFYLFINGVFTGQFNNIRPEGNQIGFNVGTDSEISVDYLTVSELKNQTSPVIAVSDSKKENNAAKTSIGVKAIMTSGPGPVVTWVSPSGQKTSLESFTAKVKANITSGSGIKSVLLYVNGVSKGEAEVKSVEGSTREFLVEKTISFGPGENQIYLVATNNEGTTKSEIRYFTNPSAIAPVITWASPVNPNSIVSTESFRIGACIKSPTDLKSVRLLVNGDVQIENNIFPISGTDECDYTWESPVVLKDGDNSIYIIATNIAGSTTSEKRLIKFSTTLAERRLALIFGNSEYRNKTVLRNPVNDANLMEGTLKELGFEVIKRLNAGKDEMMSAIKEFNEKLPSYNVALFYYAGHGNQVDGKNYMIPTDAKLEKPSDCKFEAIGVDFVVEEFERYPDNTNIVILDACRNNPYASWARGEEAGYRAMSFSSGTIIAFATSEGATAADGKGANGLYTQELVKQMVIPQSVYNVFMKARVQVKKLSNGQQIPTEWNKLNGDFFFKK